MCALSAQDWLNRKGSKLASIVGGASKVTGGRISLRGSSVVYLAHNELSETRASTPADEKPVFDYAVKGAGIPR